MSGIELARVYRQSRVSSLSPHRVEVVSTKRSCRMVPILGVDGFSFRRAYGVLQFARQT